MAIPSEPYLHDEKKAFEYLESVRWADGIVCPHCGVAGGRVYTLDGKSTRTGLKKCGECRKQFTVKVGTVFEHARMPLHKMLQAAHLLTQSRDRISIQQLHRLLGISYKSAWFLAQRIRKARHSGELAAMVGDSGGQRAGKPFIGGGTGAADGGAVKLEQVR
jgi:transposase-like protein